MDITRDAFGDQDKSILFGVEFEKVQPGLSPEGLHALCWRWSYLEFF